MPYPIAILLGVWRCVPAWCQRIVRQFGIDKFPFLVVVVEQRFRRDAGLVNLQGTDTSTAEYKYLDLNK